MKTERRKLQLQSLLLRSVQERLARGLADPRVRGLVTATRLELSEDLKRAKVFISVLPQEHAELTMHGLRAAAVKLRRDVADKIHVREMPSLEFVYDEGLKSQMEVMALLARDRAERGEPDTTEQESTGPDSTEPDTASPDDHAPGTPA